MPQHPEHQAAHLLDEIELFANQLIRLLDDQDSANLDILAELLNRYGTTEAIEQLHRLFWAVQDLVRDAD